jgi:D-3-phosphoglycerate dehydrogenase / 2-oxoglutarate reductase
VKGAFVNIVLSESYQSHVPNRFGAHQVRYFAQAPTSTEEFFRQIERAEILGVGRPIRSFRFDRELIGLLPDLQFIHATGTGTDWFDVDALAEHGILLANNHGFNASNVSEHALTLIMLAMRNTHWYIDELRRGQWKREEPPGGVLQIRGKTAGIVGLGQSGSYLANALLGLGARVVAYQRTQRPEISILGGIEWMTFDDLLQESDIVSLHVPLTTETRGMIGTRELELMKPTAVLVNCARGSVIDERALYDALTSGKIRAAALDVFAQEPTSPDNPLLKLDNLVATAHCGGFSDENTQEQVDGTLENIERFVSGLMPLRIANPEVLESNSLRASIPSALE